MNSASEQKGTSDLIGCEAVKHLWSRLQMHLHRNSPNRSSPLLAGDHSMLVKAIKSPSISDQEYTPQRQQKTHVVL